MNPSAVTLLLCALVAFPSQAEETRTPVPLPAAEHQLVLSEMRSFLETVESITTALAREDFNTVAQAARKAGMAEARKAMPRLRPYMPEGFRQLGHATHQAFDQLALDAELEDVQHSLRQLGEILSRCTACHRAYRFERMQEK